MESMILDKVDVKMEKAISILPNGLNDLDMDSLIDQMESFLERFDEVFSNGNKQKK